jgi:hypothetical protein
LTRAEQVEPQLIPTDDRTLPVLVGPPSDTESTYWISVNVLVTVVPPAATVTVHGLLAQPVIAAVEPVDGVAVTVTWVPSGIDAEQPEPQFRLPPPAHDAVTVPVPLPFLARLKLAFFSTKEAVTAVGCMSGEIVHVVMVEELQPVQPFALESEPGFDVSMIVEPLLKLPMHWVVAQGSVPVMVPLPLTLTVTAYCLRLKTTDGVTLPLMLVMLQIVLPVPEVDEQPVQPPKVYSAAGAAVSARLDPEVRVVLQGKVVQLTPVPVTVPDPVADTLTLYWFSVKVAVTVVPASATLVTQLPVPGQPVTLLHPVNVEPPDAVADSVTCVPLGICAEQVVPQLMELAPPFQEAVTTPEPLPAFAMLKLAFFSTNVAVTVAAALIDVSAQVPVAFVQAPDQPVKL